jgi:Fe2+ or Zn2+ uptake regulation protein
MRMRGKARSVNGHQELLKSCGLRPTDARLAIVCTLQTSLQLSVTAVQIYLALMRQKFSMPLSSIYRCLNSMEQRGIVMREPDSSGKMSKVRYILVERQRAAGICRFHCRCCGTLIEIADAILYNALQEHTRLVNFLPFAEVLRVESLCVKCASFSGIRI